MKKLVKHVYSTHGPPEHIISDRGASFTAGLMQQVHDYLQVERHTTTAYHPQSNGQTERLNKTISSMLRKYCWNDPAKWDEYVCLVRLAYNTSVHSATEMTPHMALFGNEADSVLERALIPHKVLLMLDHVEGDVLNFIESVQRVQALCAEMSERYVTLFATSKSLAI